MALVQNMEDYTNGSVDDFTLTTTSVTIDHSIGEHEAGRRHTKRIASQMRSLTFNEYGLMMKEKVTKIRRSQPLETNSTALLTTTTTPTPITESKKTSTTFIENHETLPALIDISPTRTQTTPSNPPNFNQTSTSHPLLLSTMNPSLSLIQGDIIDSNRQNNPTTASCYPLLLTASRSTIRQNLLRQPLSSLLNTKLIASSSPSSLSAIRSCQASHQDSHLTNISSTPSPTIHQQQSSINHSPVQNDSEDIPLPLLLYPPSIPLSVYSNNDNNNNNNYNYSSAYHSSQQSPPQLSCRLSQRSSTVCSSSSLLSTSTSLSSYESLVTNYMIRNRESNYDVRGMAELAGEIDKENISLIAGDMEYSQMNYSNDDSDMDIGRNNSGDGNSSGKSSDSGNCGKNNHMFNTDRNGHSSCSNSGNNDGSGNSNDISTSGSANESDMKDITDYFDLNNHQLPPSSSNGSITSQSPLQQQLTIFQDEVGGSCFCWS